MNADEPLAKRLAEISLGGDISTLSLDDLDERVELLKMEIARLQDEHKRKSSSMAAAQSFFKN